MIREERKRKKRRKKILIGFLIFFLTTAIALLIVVKVFTVDRSKMVIEGNNLYENTVIQDVILNDEYSWNSLYVFIKYRFIETEPVPFIDTMEVTLKDPHTLQVRVYEKGILGYLYDEEIQQYVYFDKDGLVVETSDRKIEDIPKISGLECEEVVLFEKLPIDGSYLKEILLVTQTLKRSDLIPEEITYGVENEPVIRYKKVKIEMGNLATLTQKVERIKQILPQVKEMTGTLHLENWTEESTNIVFEKQE